MTGWDVVALCAQVALAVVGLHALHRRVFPQIADAAHADLLIDVWGPVTLVLPLLFFLPGVGRTVAVTGWTPLAGPVVAGWIALAAVLIVGTMGVLAPVTLRSALIWSATGLFLLLLTAAHRLSVPMGQCALAGGAVLLWINTPHVADGADDPAAVRRQAGAGLGLTVALLAALGQGIAATQVDGSLGRISAGLAIGYLTIGLCAASAAGGSVALRLGGWCATFGVLFGLGTLALLRMLPIVFDVLRGIPTPRDPIVATGFGAFAPEAIALILLGPAIPITQGLPRRGQITLGIAILLVVAALTAWRLGRL